ncbi:MAG: hypothetical protein ACMG6E_07865, partial [Candidatus Roizmanbacteria bacterium]
WLYGHRGNTLALISDRVNDRLRAGDDMVDIMKDYAWLQAIFPGDGNPGTSWTTDIEVARSFGHQGGVVEMTTLRKNLISIPQLVSELGGKWPAPLAFREQEMYFFGIVHKDNYRLIEKGRMLEWK